MIRQLKWHHKTIGPLTYYQAREYFLSLTGLEFPSIEDLRDGIAKYPSEFMNDYPYWSRVCCDETMHAFVVYSDGTADTLKYEHHAYFRPCMEVLEEESDIEMREEKEGEH